MDIRRLKHFVKVAELGSINKAAEAVRISQPSLSRQIRLLEDELGVKLLERHSQGIDLTSDGKDFCERITSHIAGIDDAVNYIRNHSKTKKIELTMALSPDIMALISARLYSLAESDLPNLKLGLIDSHIGVTAKAIHSGEIDAAMVYTPRAYWQAEEWGGLLSRVQEFELFIDEYVLVGPPDCTIQEGSTIRVDDLLKYKLALMDRRGQHYSVRRAVDRMMEMSGNSIDFIELNSTGARRNMVESGKTFSFFTYTEIYEQIAQKRVKRYRMDSISMERHAVLVVNERCGHKDTVGKLANMIKGEVARMAGEIGHDVRIL